MSLTHDIKEYGLSLGYSKVGITSADPFPEYAEHFHARGDAYSWMLPQPGTMDYLCSPRKSWPEAKSIIIIVLDYLRTSIPTVFDGKVARLYTTRNYMPGRTQVAYARRQLFLDFLAQNGITARPTVYVPDRLAAARAGTATYGNNNFIYLEGASSFIHPFSITVDKELEYDKPTLKIECPPDCHKCVDACPTKALYAPLRLNPRRCIAFNTFSTQDGPNKLITSLIPLDIRENMGMWIHGCDICQEVCPRNHVRLHTQLPSDSYLEMLAQDFDLRKVLNLNDEYFNTRVRPIMYHYIKDKKYFQRNAAIALGNTRDSNYIPDLVMAMSDPEPMVRGYAAWGLGNIGGEKANLVLERALLSESDPFARNEIETAIRFA